MSLFMPASHAARIRARDSKATSHLGHSCDGCNHRSRRPLIAAINLLPPHQHYCHRHQTHHCGARHRSSGSSRRGQSPGKDRIVVGEDALDFRWGECRRVNGHRTHAALEVTVTRMVRATANRNRTFTCTSHRTAPKSYDAQAKRTSVMHSSCGRTYLQAGTY